MFAKLIGPVFVILMNNFKYGSYDSNHFGMLLGLHYQSIFLAQGIVDTFYLQECLKYREELGQTVLAPLSVGGFYILMSFTSPMNHSDTGFLFYYPLYFKYLYQSLHTVGSWQWVYALVWVMKECANQKFNDYAYSVIVESSMWAYISHYFFIVVSANYIVRPWQLSYYPAVFTNMVFTWICVFSSNALLDRLMGSTKANQIAKSSVQIGVKLTKKLVKKKNIKQ